VRLALGIIGALSVALLLIAGAVYFAVTVSPLPAVLLIRHGFDRGAAKASAALEPYMPDDVASELNVRYDASDPSGYLDVFFPKSAQQTQKSLTTVVWIHGGAWVSGNKDQISSYARIVAHLGFTVVSVDYAIAPEKHYPVPVREVNAALGYLAKNARRLHVDPARFVLAGDSAGAQIAAQVANLIAVPSYAAAMGVAPAIPRKHLLGAVLYCGLYDLNKLDFDGPSGGFWRTVLWAYSGGKDFQTNSAFSTASVIKYATSTFPSAFISTGNADPLAAQSYEFASALKRKHVRVDSLFFLKGQTPPLGHEYQFDLDTNAGQTALTKSATFLVSLRRIAGVALRPKERRRRRAT
jgi:acetyl esterase/lipase